MCPPRAGLLSWFQHSKSTLNELRHSRSTAHESPQSIPHKNFCHPAFKCKLKFSVCLVKFSLESSSETNSPRQRHKTIMPISTHMLFTMQPACTLVCAQIVHYSEVPLKQDTQVQWFLPIAYGGPLLSVTSKVTQIVLWDLIDKWRQGQQTWNWRKVGSYLRQHI